MGRYWLRITVVCAVLFLLSAGAMAMAAPSPAPASGGGDGGYLGQLALVITAALAGLAAIIGAFAQLVQAGRHNDKRDELLLELVKRAGVDDEDEDTK